MRQDEKTPYIMRRYKGTNFIHYKDLPYLTKCAVKKIYGYDTAIVSTLKYWIEWLEYHNAMTEEIKMELAPYILGDWQ